MRTRATWTYCEKFDLDLYKCAQELCSLADVYHRFHSSNVSAEKGDPTSSTDADLDEASLEDDALDEPGAKNHLLFSVLAAQLIKPA